MRTTLVALLLISLGCSFHKDSKKLREANKEQKQSSKQIVLKVVGAQPPPNVSKPVEPGCLPEDHPLNTGEVVEALWAAFRSIPWDEVSPGNCQEFRGDGYSRQIQEEWCFHCRDCKSTHLEERFYYALEADASACRLEEYHASVSRNSDSWLLEAHALLAAKLDANLGVGDSPVGILEASSGLWKHLKRWRTQDVLVYLYVDGGRVVLRARHHHLDKAMAEARGIDPLLSERHPRGVTPLDFLLGEKLQKLSPDLPALLGQKEQKNDLRVIPPVLLKLLENLKDAPAELQPAILLACDRLADRLWTFSESSSEWDALQPKLQRYGLRFEWDHLGGCWVYRHDLLRKIDEEFGNSEWSDEAFLLLMRHGFDTSAGCRESEDQFRNVIGRGEAFLKRNLSSAHRIEALFLLAEAYETWWSLGKAADTDEYVNREHYVEGAETARLKAIRAYKQVRELAPGTLYAISAGLKLPRLKLRLDTNQRRFFCIYD